MNQEKMKDISSQVIDRALQKGADAGDVIGRSGRSFSVSVQKGEIDKFKVSSAAIIGLRVIKNHRVGLAYTESFDSSSLDRVVQQALENAQYAAVDENQAIIAAEPQVLIEDHPGLFQEDTTSMDDKLALALKLEKDLLESDSRIASSPYNGYSDGEGEISYLNHFGTYRFQKERSFHCYLSALARDGQRQAMYGFSSNARSFQGLDSQKCVAQTLRYALPLLGAKPIPTGRYKLVFELDELEQLLACYIGTFSAKEVLEGKSGLKGRLGEKVGSELLSLRDEPQYEQGFYYSRFDDEGQLRKPLSLIENGVLKSYLQNTATARQFSCKTTGHGSRSAKSSLGVSATQTVIDVGPHHEDEVLGADHLRVISLKGLHSGTNAVSGHFSLALEGILYRDGKEQQYVKDVTISGNFYELLQNISLMGNRLHANSTKTFFAPYILFHNISVAGT